MMEEGELAVFFRNNHFSTVLKRKVRERGREGRKERGMQGGRGKEGRREGEGKRKGRGGEGGREGERNE